MKEARSICWVFGKWTSLNVGSSLDDALASIATYPTLLRYLIQRDYNPWKARRHLCSHVYIKLCLYEAPPGTASSEWRAPEQRSTKPTGRSPARSAVLPAPVFESPHMLPQCWRHLSASLVPRTLTLPLCLYSQVLSR
ncbi:hypothetical protein OH77DRAFT_851152 [Trametes cingulata]|nr:hypothetical protein OH77DRAFT_851152 [Trametes cingulata]